MELDWEHFIEIADKFQHKAKAADREDLRQDIILRLAEVASNNGHKPFTEGAMVRVASYTVMAYWRDRMRKPTILSLNGELDNGDGDTVELWQTLADDKAIDVEAWLDAKRWLLGCPKRLVQIAYKRYIGKPLEWRDRTYLQSYRRKELKKYQEVLTIRPSFGTI
jgi:DNA-directed RNA polymerase specialized sigma24 family protein